MPHVGRRLPLNRKERFYTGTVLPMVVAADGPKGLRPLLDLCRLPREAQADSGDLSTEYSLVESVLTPADRARFAPLPAEKDTPDVVIAGEDWLLVIEAKMFHRPSAKEMREQLRRQEPVIECLTRVLDVPPAMSRHVALLPANTLVDVDLGVPIVRWEDVLETYRDVAPPYWVNVLDAALSSYAELASRELDFSRNAEAKILGEAILKAYRAGTFTYRWMGRRRGLDGPDLAEDIASGRWRTYRYQVRASGRPNDNWFAVDDFVALLTSGADL